MDETIELRYAGWVLTVSCIDDDGTPLPTHCLSVTCEPYHRKGVIFRISIRATSQVLSLIDVPDDPDDYLLMQAYTQLIWLINLQRRTATLTFLARTSEKLPAAKVTSYLLGEADQNAK